MCADLQSFAMPIRKENHMQKISYIYKTFLITLLVVIIAFLVPNSVRADEDEYMVSVVDGENGTLTVTYNGEEISGGETVKKGSVIRLANEPDKYYRFLYYLVNGEPFYNPQYTVNSDVEISAVFVPKTYKISAKVTGGQGSISTGDMTTVNAGEEVTVTLLPAPGYIVSQLIVNGEDVTDLVPDDNIYVTDDTWEGLSVNVTFERIRLDIEASTDGNGVVRVADSVEYGSDLYITFEPDRGYVLGDVYIDDKKVQVTDNRYLLSNVTESHSIYAEFTEVYCNVDVKTGEHGSASESGTVRYGDKYVLMIYPDKGYQVDEILLNGTPVYATQGKYVIESVEEDINIAIAFEPNEIGQAKIQSVTSKGVHELKVLWEAVDGAEGYEIYRKTDGGSGYRLIADVKAAYFEQSYTDTKVKCGVKYHYKVKAYKERWNDKLYGLISSSKSGHSAPVKSRISSINNNGISSIIVKWDRVKDVHGYEVYVSTEKNGTYKLYRRTSGNKKADRTVTIKGLATGSRYYVKIRAYRRTDGGYIYGRYSTVKSCETTYFTKVKGIRARMEGFEYAKIVWNKKSGVDGYVVYWSEKKNGRYQRIATVKGGNIHTYSDAFFVTGKNYYKVKAYKDINGKRVYGSASDAAGVNAVIKTGKN